MRTVKEMSELTGISVRTLHYYDEIGLLKPSCLSEAGYRLYDDEAMKTLQQILFFKELDLPLKQIKVILENPELDKTQLLSRQRRMLELKKERLERIIASIGDILKGVNKMDFGVFSKTDMEQLYHEIEKNMTEDQKEIFVKEYGSLDQFRDEFLKQSTCEETLESIARAVEWYGGKECLKETVANLNNSNNDVDYGEKLDQVIKKLAAMKGLDLHSPVVIDVVNEMDAVAKELYQMADVSAFMLDMADRYLGDTTMQKHLDTVYGEGSTVFIGQVLQAYYA